jgi:hypothetical protein
LGWLWLGFSRTTVEQREYCFQKALSLNPQNEDAKRQLEILKILKAPPAPQAPQSPPPIPVATAEPPKAAPAAAAARPLPRKPAAGKKRSRGTRWLYVLGIVAIAIVCICALALVLYQLLGNPAAATGLLPTATTPPAASHIAFIIATIRSCQ